MGAFFMETISTLTYLSMQLVKVLDIRKIKSNGNNYIQAQFRTGTQWGNYESISTAVFLLLIIRT